MASSLGGAPRAMRPRWHCAASTAVSACVAGPTATTPHRVASTRSRPTAARSTECRRTTACFTGRRPRSMAGCSASGSASDAIEVALVYFEISSQRETVAQRTAHGCRLARLLRDAMRTVSWPGAGRKPRTPTARQHALHALTFPHATFRSGQRALSEAVYRAAIARRCLVAQAPTGIGKTVATLFALLKAWPTQSFDKLFFLTAKGTGRHAALDALAQLRGAGADAGDPRRRAGRARQGLRAPRQGLPRRILSARRPASTTACRQRVNRRSRRRSSIGTRCAPSPARISVCPYYLGQELARWADIVVGDFNHYFDSNAILFGLAAAHEWRVAVLVDEAHNLLERGRAMYSARLARSTLQALRRSAPPVLSRPMERLQRRWRELQHDQLDAHRTHPAVPERIHGRLEGCLHSDRGSPRRAAGASRSGIVGVPLRRPPLPPSRRLCLPITRSSTRRSNRDRPDRADAVPIWPSICATSCLRRICVRGSRQLRPACLFSATLDAFEFHCDMLGIPSTSAWLDVDTPFAADAVDGTHRP